IVLKEEAEFVLSDIANLSELVRIIIPDWLRLVDETALGYATQRARQERQQVFGKLLVSEGNGTGQTCPRDAGYRRQCRIADQGPRAIWSGLDTALVRGSCTGQPIFSAKLVGMFSFRPTEAIRVNPPRTDLVAAVKNSVGDAIIGEAQSPRVDLRIDRSPVNLEQCFSNVRTNVVAFRRSNGIGTGS